MTKTRSVPSDRELAPAFAKAQQNRGRNQTAARERFDRILHDVRERIILLEYPPGMRLREEELAREFSVSRTPIRTVLSRLQYEGLVEVWQGSGTYITQIDWDDLTDAYEFRMRLAELIGELKPTTLPASNLEKVRQIRDQVRERGVELTTREYRQWNSALQSEINGCIGNRLLRETIEQLYFLTQRHWFAWQPFMDWDREIDAFQWQLDNTVRCLELGDIRGVGLVWRNVISAMMRRLSECRERAQAAERQAVAQESCGGMAG